MDFAEADTVMNALWQIGTSPEFWADHDWAIPKVIYAVYLAFDAGEYCRSTDAPGTDPEKKYTKPLIAAFLAEHDRTDT